MSTFARRKNHYFQLVFATFLVAAITLGPTVQAQDSATTPPAAAISSVAPDTQPAKTVLIKGDRLAIVGDSITEQKIYSRYMEDYLTACTPDLDLWIVQLGWSGETAAGFDARMTPDLLSLKPTVITTCYGMNDGDYGAYKKMVGKKYTKSMTELVERAKKADVRVVIIGSPGIVGNNWPKGTFFAGRAVTSAIYNDTLAHLTEIDRNLAAQQGEAFADIHDLMKTTMDAALIANGKNYALCGTDNVHPGPNGHLVMAYSLLKAMGLDGQIGVITIDMDGSAQATPGHKVIQSSNGSTVIESTRYPFCFLSEPYHVNDSALSILPFLPFNQDLNRFMLVVKGLKTAKARVSWGGPAKTFTREELEAGINLAAEFSKDNPFTESFRKLDGLVAQKQAFETEMIKNLYHLLPVYENELAGNPAAPTLIKNLYTNLNDIHDALEANVKAAVVPVRHTITVTPD